MSALLVSFPGTPPGDRACEAEYVGSPRVTIDTVALSVDPTEPPDDRPCPGIAYLRTVHVELPEPLGARVVVDAGTSRPVPLLDGPALLAAPAPPPGYVYDGEYGDGGASWTHRYGSGERAPRLTVTHAEDSGRPLDEHRVTLDEVDVRGHEALVLTQTDSGPTPWPGASVAGWCR